jgi:sugar transferase (PEP-CTERM system associated)
MLELLMRRMRWRPILLIAGETALMFGAVVLGAYIRLGDEAWSMLGSENMLPKGLLIALACQVCLHYRELYDLRIVTDRRELFVRTFQALGAASMILAGVYYWFPDLIIGRGVFMLAAALVATVVVGWRVFFEWLSHNVGPRERLLLVGTTPGAVALARELYERKELGVEIIGFIDPDPARVGAPVINPGVIGTLDEIPQIVRNRGVDRVVVGLIDARGRLPVEKLLGMKMEGVAFDHLASVYEEYTGKIAISNLRPSWLIFSSGFRKTRPLIAMKRSLDVLAAFIGLVLALPLMAIVAAAIKLTSKGPALYHQTRVGQRGRPFTIHKFRSMRVDAEVGTGAVWASKADDRITTVGRFLRKTRFDELPQLWNVLRGDMSFVGPRPERPEFVDDLTKAIPFYGERHVVKPGLTGWAQVCYTYGASVEDAMEKLQYDLYYIKNLSIALDLFIIFKTIKTVLLGSGAQ